MIQLDAALMATPVHHDRGQRGDGQRGDFLATLTSLLDDGATTNPDAAELLGEHLSEEALAALAEAGSVLDDHEGSWTDAESTEELLAGLAVAVEAAELPPETSALWRLQAALYAAAHGEAPNNVELPAQDQAVEEAPAEGETDEVEASPTAPKLPEGTTDETAIGDQDLEGDEVTTATVATAAAAGAETRVPNGPPDDGEGEANPEARDAGRVARAGARGADRSALAGEPTRAATAAPAPDADEAAGEVDETLARRPGREGLTTTGIRAETVAGRGEQRVDASTAFTSEAPTTATRSEVSETGAMRPSAAAATLERVLEAAARLERMPPPRQLTLEVGEARVRLGIEDGALRVQLLDDGQPKDRELLRDVTTELRNRGFNLGADQGGGADHGSRSETSAPTPAAENEGNPSSDRAAPRMPAHATTALRL